MKLYKNERAFDAINILTLTVFAFIVVFPFWYVIASSITSYEYYSKAGGLIFFPKNITFEYYSYLLLKSNMIYNSYFNTIFNAVAGTFLGLLITSLAAYGVAEKKLPGRKAITMFFFFTFFFNGGIIPTYITVRNLGLLNNRITIIMVSLFAVFNLILLKTFFESLPESLKESATIDGASELRILFQIVFPLSMPAIATLGLFMFVYYWNDFFQAALYITNSKLYPVQLLLLSIVTQASLPTQLITSVGEQAPPAIMLKLATIVITALPMILIYPFVQKYFEQGIMIGAVKG